MNRTLAFFLLFLGINFSGYAQYSEQSPFTSSFNNRNPIETIWDVVFNYDARAATGGVGNAGALYIPPLQQFWTSRWSSNRIYVWNKYGIVIDSFSTTGFTGTRNMCFNGTEVVHATTTGILQRVNPVTRQTIGTVTLPPGVTARFISYNPDADGGNGGYWVGNWNAGALNFYLVSKTGIQLSVIPNTAITGTYGIAYDYWSVGGPFLWVWSQGGGVLSPQKIIQISIATGLPTGVEHDVKTDIGIGNTSAIAGGLFISDQIVPGYLTLGGVLQGGGITVVDRLFGYELKMLDPNALRQFNLVSPGSGDTVITFPGAASIKTFYWDSAATHATYKWIFGSPTTSNRLLEIPVANNSLSLTINQIDSMISVLGLLPGQSITGQWDVWAFRNDIPVSDSIKSKNGPRTITFLRNSTPLLPFSLVSPINYELVYTSMFDQSPIRFKWNKSGDGVSYKVRIYKYYTLILTLPDTGYVHDTTVSIKNCDFDAFLESRGLMPGFCEGLRWSVVAYYDSDSLMAKKFHDLRACRKERNVLVLYDSTLSDCINSKDSVVTALNSLNMAHDVMNRGSNTSPFTFDLRFYKKVILLGEGRSIMSPSLKDSLKSFLNAGNSYIKKNLIIFSEDVGYMLGRSESELYDPDFLNNYLGVNYVMDKPTSGGAQGLIGITINSLVPDSTVGESPDVLSVFNQSSGRWFYGFRFDIDVLNAIGNQKSKYETATFAVDVESLRAAVDGPGGSPIYRMLKGTVYYLLPVELISFLSRTKGNHVTLTWSTATETNNEGFTVQRKAADATVYENLGFVRGNGTTAETSNYSFTDSKANVGTYHYRLLQRDLDGTTHYSEPLVVEVTNPNTFVLEQNYPNPFNPSTSIQFSIPVKARVSLKIFDIVGQEVAKLIDGELAAGYHEVVFNAAKISSGVYFYRIEANGVNGQNYNSVKKMILNK